MENRVITDADNHWITKILIQDSVFVAKKEIFYSALGLPSGELYDLRRIASSSGSESYDFCSGCLCEWISKTGALANMQKLISILLDENFRGCADNILAKIRHESTSESYSLELNKKSDVWFDVRDAGDSFAGRELELKKLHELVVRNGRSDGSVTVISQLTSVTGLGGIGKTSLARKYAFDNAEYFDGNVIWINAETSNSLKDSFQRLAKKLNIKTQDQNEAIVATSSEDYAEKIYDYFQNKKCLFIFDNVEDFKGNVENVLPKFQRGATYPHILMTSRKFEIIQKVKVLRLDVLEEFDAIKLVKDELELEEEDGLDELIKELVTKLRCLPLALQQAIAHIRRMARFGKYDNHVKKYLELFDQNATNLLRFEFYKYTTDSYAKSVYVTWLTTLQKIESAENGRFTINLMNMIAYFHCDAIEMDIFLSTFTAEEVYESIHILHDYSMINVCDGVLNVHRLVQEVIRIILVENNLEQQCLHQCLKTLNTGVFNWAYNKHRAEVWKFALKYDHLIKEFTQVGIQIMRVMAWSGTGITAATTKKFVELFGGESTYQLQLRCAQIRTLIYAQSRDIIERLLICVKRLLTQVETYHADQILLTFESLIGTIEAILLYTRIITDEDQKTVLTLYGHSIANIAFNLLHQDTDVFGDLLRVAKIIIDYLIVLQWGRRGSNFCKHFRTVCKMNSKLCRQALLDAMIVMGKYLWTRSSHASTEVVRLEMVEEALVFFECGLWPYPIKRNGTNLVRCRIGKLMCMVELQYTAAECQMICTDIVEMCNTQDTTEDITSIQDLIMFADYMTRRITLSKCKEDGDTMDGIGISCYELILYAIRNTTEYSIAVSSLNDSTEFLIECGRLEDALRLSNVCLQFCNISALSITDCSTNIRILNGSQSERLGYLLYQRGTQNANCKFRDQLFEASLGFYKTSYNSASWNFPGRKLMMATGVVKCRINLQRRLAALTFCQDVRILYSSNSEFSNLNIVNALIALENSLQNGDSCDYNILLKKLEDNITHVYGVLSFPL